jgi:hypothetical protein
MLSKRAASVVSVPSRLVPIRAFVIGVGLLAIASSSSAKCPLVLYEVRGRLESTGAPLEGREVIAFFDDYRHAIGKHASKPSRAISDSQGRFALTGFFDSYRWYSWWGHNCSRVPERLELIILSRDQEVERLVFRRRALAIHHDGNHSVITLPTIQVDQ